MDNEKLKRTAGLQDCERARLYKMKNEKWRINNYFKRKNYSLFIINYKFKHAVAFTLAEVLITLGIIGVVAAMTMPVLINKINDQEYDRARQKALASIGEAGRLIAIEGNMASETNAENFVKNVLSKKLKIAKMCDANHLSDCGWTDTINVQAKGKNMKNQSTISLTSLKNINGIANYVYDSSTTNALKTQNSYGFLTANGYSVILFYNPNCIADKKDYYTYAHDYVCMNAIYDMNGKKNPNQVGKDIGYVSVLYPDETTNRAVAPNPTDENAKIDNKTYLVWSDANSACSGKGLSLPDVEELQSMAYNSLLTNLAADGYWSGTVQRGQAGRAWIVGTGDGSRYGIAVGDDGRVRCVRR